jgi:hypothetical protein
VSLLTIPLAGATLTGGATLKAAGGGLPERITVSDFVTVGPAAADYYFDGPFWHNDGQSFWITPYAISATLERYNKAGVNVQTITLPGGTNPIGTWAHYATPGTPHANDRIYVTDYSTGNVLEYNFAGVLQTTTATGLVSDLFFVVRSDPGKIWVRDTAENWREWNIGGAATGRIIAAGSFTAGRNASSAYATPGNLWLSSGDAAYRVETVGLTVLASWEPAIANKYIDTDGNHVVNTIVYVDSSNRPWMYDDSNGRVVRWVAGGAATGATVVDKVIFWGTASLQRSPAGTSLGTINHANHAIAPSVDGSWVVFVSALNTDVNPSHSFGLLNIGVQKATFVHTFDAAGTLERFLVPGNLGNTIDAAKDFRRTRCYWKLNAGVRAEFGPNGTFAPINVASGDVITVDVEFDEFAMPPASPPYVEEGIVLSMASSALPPSLPAINTFTPAEGTSVSKLGVIQFDVTGDSSAIDAVVLVASFDGGASTEIIYANGGFNQRLYSGASNTRTAADGGFRFNVLRDNGWIGPVTIEALGVGVTPLTDVEYYRTSEDLTDAQTLQAAVNAGVPLIFPRRTYVIGAGETIINTSCHYMEFQDTVLKLADGAVVNTDGDSQHHTPIMQHRGVQGLVMKGRLLIDGNRDHQTYPATLANFGRGTAIDGSVGRRNNGCMEFVPANDNATPCRGIELQGFEVANGYLNGLVFWQTERVTVRGCYTHDNAANGIAAENVTGFTVINPRHERDGASDAYPSTVYTGDRGGVQVREIPGSFTSAQLGIPHIASVDGKSLVNYDVSIIGGRADRCGVEGWFLRCCFPGRISNCYSTNVGYKRHPAADPVAAHYWTEGGWSEHNDNVCVQSVDNSVSGWQRPDGLVCQTFEGDGSGTQGGAPFSNGGLFKSSIRGFRAVCGYAGTVQQNNFNRGMRVYSACVVSDYHIEGTNAEAVRIENDINFNLLPPHDVKLFNGDLSNVKANSVIEVSRFNNGGAVVVSGDADGIEVDGLRVRGLSTTLVGSDDHAIINFNSTMATYAAHNLRLVNLDLDGANSGAGNVMYNGVRLRVSETSRQMRVDFKRARNCFSPVRTGGFQWLRVSGSLEACHRILLVDHSANTADGGELRILVQTSGITDELFFLQNMATWALGAFVLEPGCYFGGASLCRTFAASAAPNGNITTTADNFFAQARMFIWRDTIAKYGSNNPATLVYDMRRRFSGATTLNLATPYYVGEVVFRTDDNSVMIGVDPRTAGAWKVL